MEIMNAIRIKTSYDNSIDREYFMKSLSVYIFYARVGNIGNRTGVRSERVRFLVQTDSLFSLCSA